MDLSKTPGRLATEAADAIRALNYKTLNDSYEDPPAAGEAAYALKPLVERMPQALQQLDAALLRFDANDAIRIGSVHVVEQRFFRSSGGRVRAGCSRLRAADRW
ncbi:hypothetical protein AB0G85_35695 [Streptomyces sioyaensis]|uniref:hypothetical protein n=1 Tax=Streptomyces sioyaensis TaxID=67364 RepID=UPI0033D259BA